MQVNKEQMIGQGNTAEIYRLDDNKILNPILLNRRRSRLVTLRSSYVNTPLQKY